MGVCSTVCSTIVQPHMSSPETSVQPSLATRPPFESPPRVLIVLHEKGLQFEVKHVDLANKSQEFEDAYSSVHPVKGARAQVPVFIDSDGTTLLESMVIAQYLDDKHATPALMPAGAVARAKVRLFIELFPGIMPAAFYALMAAEEGPERERRKDGLIQALETLDHFLRLHGGDDGDYFAGKEFTLADVIAATIFNIATMVLPRYRGMDVWEEITRHNLTRLERWGRAVLARPSVQRACASPEDVFFMAEKHRMFKL